MAIESRIVLLPTRSRTASTRFSAMCRERSGRSNSTRRAPSAVNFGVRSRLRVVAMTLAPAWAAMFSAAWPSAEVAPRSTSAWPLLSSRFRCRQVQAVAYDSGIAASSAQGSFVSIATTFDGHGRVLSVVAINGPSHAAHEGRDFLSEREFTAGAGLDDADTF